MNRVLFSVYRIAVPKPLRSFILKKIIRSKILRYFSQLSREDINDEQEEVVKFLENKPLEIFPYTFAGNYSPDKIIVFADSVNKMKYVDYNGMKLYFRRGWTNRRVKKGWSELLKEQDPNSPHRYLTGDFYPSGEDVIADIGAAEGNFSLSVIEKVRKAYLFEYDNKWIKALGHTFEPWKEKAVIVPRYVSDIDDSRHIRLDTIFMENPGITFLKIDVDGFEKEVLRGFKNTLESGIPLKIVLCTYHKGEDEAAFTELLGNYGFEISVSKGYMINYYDKKIKAPWLRRGLIRAIRP
jgi:hypothetical protein